MARTKQTARKSSGGKAPRTLLAAIANRIPCVEIVTTTPIESATYSEEEIWARAKPLGGPRQWGKDGSKQKYELPYVMDPQTPNHFNHNKLVEIHQEAVKRVRHVQIPQAELNADQKQERDIDWVAYINPKAEEYQQTEKGCIFHF